MNRIKTFDDLSEWSGFSREVYNSNNNNEGDVLTDCPEHEFSPHAAWQWIIPVPTKSCDFRSTSMPLSDHLRVERFTSYRRSFAYQSLHLVWIGRASAANAAADQIATTASTGPVVVGVCVSIVSAWSKEWRSRASGRLRAVAGRVEADGAGTEDGARGAVVVEEWDVAAGDDAGVGAAAGTNNLQRLLLADIGLDG